MWRVPGQIPSLGNIPSMEIRRTPTIQPNQDNSEVSNIDDVVEGLNLSDEHAERIKRMLTQDLAVGMSPSQMRGNLMQFLKYERVAPEQRRAILARAGKLFRASKPQGWEQKRRMMIGLRRNTKNQEFIITPTRRGKGEIMDMNDWLSKNVTVDMHAPSQNVGPSEMEGLVQTDTFNEHGFAGDEQFTAQHAQGQENADYAYKSFGSDRPDEQKDVQAEGPAPKSTKEDGEGEAEEGDKKPNPFEAKDKGDDEGDEGEKKPNPFEKGGLSEWLAKAIPGASDPSSGSAKSANIQGSRSGLPKGVEVNREEDGGKVNGNGKGSGIAKSSAKAGECKTSGLPLSQTGPDKPFNKDDPKKSGSFKTNEGLQKEPIDDGSGNLMNKAGHSIRGEEDSVSMRTALARQAQDAPRTSFGGIHQHERTPLEAPIARTVEVFEKGGVVYQNLDDLRAMESMNAQDELNKGGISFPASVSSSDNCPHCSAVLHKAISDCPDCGNYRYANAEMNKAMKAADFIPATDARGLVMKPPHGEMVDCSNGLFIED